MIAVPEESMLQDRIKNIVMKKKVRKVVTHVSLRFLEIVYFQFIRESTAEHI